jgi:hypothetical protein
MSKNIPVNAYKDLVDSKSGQVRVKEPMAAMMDIGWPVVDVIE